MVVEYTKELHDLVCQLNDWPKDILISCFKDGLNNDLYNTCISWGAPAILHDWYILAEEVAIDQACNRHHSA